jgi:hypothetical protein
MGIEQRGFRRVGAVDHDDAGDTVGAQVIGTQRVRKRLAAREEPFNADAAAAKTGHDFIDVDDGLLRRNADGCASPRHTASSVAIDRADGANQPCPRRWCRWCWLLALLWWCSRNRRCRCGCRRCGGWRAGLQQPQHFFVLTAGLHDGEARDWRVDPDALPPLPVPLGTHGVGHHAGVDVLAVMPSGGVGTTCTMRIVCLLPLSRSKPEWIVVSATDVVDLARLCRGHARIGVTLAFETSGGAPGHLAFVLDEDVAVRLVAGLTGARDAELGTTALMALAEVGNIAASAFLNGAASVVGRACLPSVPRVLHAPVEQSVRAAMPPGAVQVATLVIDGNDVVTVAFVPA